MCISNKISLHLYQPFRCGSYEHQMIEKKWDGLGLDGKGYSHFFFLEYKWIVVFVKKIGKRTQWISRSVFVKMWIFWFCQSIFMFPLYCLGRLKPQQMPTVITLVPGMTVSQLLALQLPPHVLIHKMRNVQFQFFTLFFHDS